MCSENIQCPHVTVFIYTFSMMNKKYYSALITHVISCRTLNIICHRESYFTERNVFGKDAINISTLEITGIETIMRRAMKIVQNSIISKQRSIHSL